MKMYSGGLICPKCGQLASVYYARDFRRRYGIAPGFKDQDTVVIKVSCPKHGKMKQTLNPFNKEAWMDDFAGSMLQCMKCEKIGTIENIQEKGQWMIFRIYCPEHGLSGFKRVVSTLFYLVTELQRLGITYKKYMQTQPPTTFTVCPNCGHVVEPGNKFCDICGTSLIPK